MSPSSNRILAEALALPESDRLELAAELLASVDGAPDEDWDVAWLEELKARAEAADQRPTATSPWSEARERILDRITRR